MRWGLEKRPEWVALSAPDVGSQTWFVAGLGGIVMIWGRVRNLLAACVIVAGVGATPAAGHVHDGDEIDPRHHAMGRPVMAPVMDREILYPRALAGGGVLVLDRVAAGDFGLAGVLIGFAEPIGEDMALERPSTLFPDGAEAMGD